MLDPPYQINTDPKPWLSKDGILDLLFWSKSCRETCSQPSTGGKVAILFLITVVSFLLYNCCATSDHTQLLSCGWRLILTHSQNHCSAAPQNPPFSSELNPTVWFVDRLVCLCWIRIRIPFWNWTDPETEPSVLWIRDIFWNGSGSADPYNWLTDPNPALFVMGIQDGNKKLGYALIWGRDRSVSKISTFSAKAKYVSVSVWKAGSGSMRIRKLMRICTGLR
jgi:hypothetical protein